LILIVLVTFFTLIDLWVSTRVGLQVARQRQTDRLTS